MELTEISWSVTVLMYSNIFMVTVQLFNSLHVLRMHFLEQVKVLSGHTSLVKGVTWDPIGKYLASQSDDRSIIVWRTRDWQQETAITKPFQESCGTTHVLRLAWSPDGSYMVRLNYSISSCLDSSASCPSYCTCHCLVVGVRPRYEQHGTHSADCVKVRLVD